jgi:hypothetical protein
MTSRPLALTVAAAWVASVATFTALFFEAGDRQHLIAPSDALSQSLPLYEEPPTDWVDTAFGGYPAFADPQGLRAYPVARLMRAAGFNFNQFTASAFVLAAFFTFLLVFFYTGHRLAGAVAAVSYSFSSFLLVHLVHVSMLHAAAWIPAALLGVTRFFETRKPGWLVLTSASMALMVLAGSPQLALYGGALVAAVGTAAALHRRSLSLFLALVIALGLGGGLSAIQLVPTAELIRFTPRAKLTPEDFSSNAMRPGLLPAWVAPRLFTPWGGPLPGPDDADLQIALALPTTLLALIGVSRGPWRREGRVLVGLAGVSLLLSFKPVAELLYHVPLYNLFRGPSRHLLNFSLLMSVASGLGLAGLAFTDFRLRVRDLFLPLAVILPLGVVGLARADVGWAGLVGWLPALGCLALTVTALRGRAPPRRLAVAFTGLLAVDAWWLAKSMAWESSAPPLSAAELPAAVREHGAECRQAGCRLLAWSGFWSAALPGNLARRWDVPSLGGYNVMYLSRLGKLLWMDANGVVLQKQRLVDPMNQSLNLLGVRYLYSSQGDSFLLEPPRFTPAGPASTDVTFRASAHRPRAWLVGEAVAVTEARAIEIIQGAPLPNDTPFDPSRTALVTDEQLQRSGPEVVGEARVVEAKPGWLHLAVKTDRPAILVVNEMEYPGWGARIDGAPARVFGANVVQLAVEIAAAGEHDIVVEFSSHQQRVGGLISLGSALLLLAFVALWGRLSFLQAPQGRTTAA